MAGQKAAPVSGVSEQEAVRKRGGRPEYKPSDADRQRVRELVAGKMPQAKIAIELKLSPVTLRKHFGAELAKKPAGDDGQLSLDTPPGAAVAGAAADATAQGRPEYEPTYREREDVKLFKADDWSDDRIAAYLKISRNTLLKHFGEELEYGVAQVRARVLRNLMRQSDKGSVSASDRILELQGMIAPVQQLPTPEAPSEPKAEPLGKKAQAVKDAQTADEGTSWHSTLSH